MVGTLSVSVTMQSIYPCAVGTRQPADEKAARTHNAAMTTWRINVTPESVCRCFSKFEYARIDGLAKDVPSRSSVVDRLLVNESKLRRPSTKAAHRERHARLLLVDWCRRVCSRNCVTVFNRIARTASERAPARNRRLEPMGHNSQFNYSDVTGNAIAAGLSNLYHPVDDRSWPDTLMRWETQMMWDVLSSELKEFWPDIRRRIRKP